MAYRAAASCIPAAIRYFADKLQAASGSIEFEEESVDAADAELRAMERSGNRRS